MKLEFGIRQARKSDRSELRRILMLVLSCKLGERIVLPGIDTTVEVVAIKGKVARLGISAPVQITVHRGEVGLLIDLQTHSIGAAGDQENFSSHE
jgi:carbon storage regulator CsrA